MFVLFSSHPLLQRRTQFLGNRLCNTAGNDRLHLLGEVGELPPPPPSEVEVEGGLASMGSGTGRAIGGGGGGGSMGVGRKGLCTFPWELPLGWRLQEKTTFNTSGKNINRSVTRLTCNSSNSLLPSERVCVSVCVSAVFMAGHKEFCCRLHFLLLIYKHNTTVPRFTSLPPSVSILSLYRLFLCMYIYLYIYIFTVHILCLYRVPVSVSTLLSCMSALVLSRRPSIETRRLRHRNT